MVLASLPDLRVLAAPRLSPRPSSSSPHRLPPRLRPLRRSRRAGRLLARPGRDAGADLLRGRLDGPQALLPPVLPVVLTCERVPFAGLSPGAGVATAVFLSGLWSARCAALRVSRRAATHPLIGVMDEASIPDGRGDVPWPRGGRGHAGGAAMGRCGAHSTSKNAILETRI